MANNTYNLWYRNMPYLIIVTIGICSFLFSFDMSYLRDNLHYSADYSKKTIKIFDKDPELDRATFKYSGANTKQYPYYPLDIAKPPLGYYVTSFEIYFKHQSILRSGIRFNEKFGLYRISGRRRSVSIT